MLGCFPPFPLLSNPREIEDIYCKLGAVYLLDACYKGASKELNHQEFYMKFMRHLEEETLIISLDSHRHPKGFATFVEKDGSKMITHVCGDDNIIKDLLYNLEAK